MSSADGAFRVEVLSLTATTAVLRGWPANPGDDATLLLTDTDGAELKVPIRAVEQESGTMSVVLRPESADSIRGLIRLCRSREAEGGLEVARTREGRKQIIQDPKRVARVLSMLHEEGRLDLESLPEPGTMVEADGPYSLFRFQSPTRGKLPEKVEHVTRRASRRIRVDVRLRFQADHPILTGLQIDSAVRDLSRTGVSFWSIGEEDALWPGLELDFELTVRGTARVRAQGVVRHVSDAAGRMVVGVEILRTDEASLSEVLEALHPLADRSGATADELWELYAESGYFGLSGKKPEDFAPYRADFGSTLSIVHKHPDQCAVFSTRTRRGLNASVHQLHMWRGGWLGYQGSRSTAPRSLDDLGNRNLAAAYVRSYEHIAQYQAEWLVGYVQQSGRWARAVSYELALPWISAGLASVTPFTAVEIMASSATTFEAPLLVRGANERERVELTARIEALETTPYIQATGLTLEELDGTTTDEWWKLDGLMRRRATRVAIRDGRAVAFAVLDATDPGLHLFQLTNACRIFAMESLAPEYVGSLLADAGRWFESCGVDRFVYFAEPNTHLPESEGILSLGDAWTTVVSGELAPLYVERIMEVATAIHPLLSDS